MNNSSKALQQHKSQSVQPLTQQENQHLGLLTHLQKLVESNPQEAREALQMSQEQAPELFLIAQSQPQTQWAASVMSSESMLSLMPLSPSQAKAMMSQPDLRSLLEMLP
jgi:Lon protease-like protein